MKKIVSFVSMVFLGLSMSFPVLADRDKQTATNIGSDFMTTVANDVVDLDQMNPNEISDELLDTLTDDSMVVQEETVKETPDGFSEAAGPDMANTRASYSIGWHSILIGTTRYHFYCEGNNKFADGMRTVGSKKFHFGLSIPGYNFKFMNTGVFSYSSGSLYAYLNGEIVTKTALIEYIWLKGGIVMLDTLFLNAKGYLVTTLNTVSEERGPRAWVSYDKKLYYYISQSSNNPYFKWRSRLVTAWQKIDGNQLYFGVAGDWSMKTHWHKLGNDQFYFGPDGVMRTGWQNVKNKYYYFSPKGMMQTNWLKIGNYHYFFGATGTMHTGVVNIKGVNHKFDGNGRYVGLA